MEDQPTPTGSEGQQPSGSVPPLRESVNAAGERIQVIIEAAEQAAAGIIEDADAQARRYIDASRKRADALADERVRVMADLTDTLIRQADVVKRQSDELLSALDSARSELATRIGQELSSGGPASGPAQLQEPAKGAPGQRVPHLHPVESGRPDLQAVESPPAEETATAEEPEAAEEPAAAEPSPPPAPQAPQAPPPEQAPPAQQSTPPPAPPADEQGGAAPSPSDGARLLAAQMAVAGSSREEIESRLRDEFGIEDAAPILDGILGPSQ
jgi:hypothetical protein